LHDGRNARAGSGDGGGIKKIFSGKNFRSRFGVMRKRSGYVQRSKFFASEYITFQGGQKRSNTERTIRSTDVADEGRGWVVGNYFSAVKIFVCGPGARGGAGLCSAVGIFCV
jgi:hypothetical protein